VPESGLVAILVANRIFPVIPFAIGHSTEVTTKVKMSGGVGESILEAFKDSWSSIEEESVAILQKLIRLDTQNCGEDGTETIAAKYVKGLFDDAGIECSDILEAKPGRGNVVARIRGDGSSGLGPVLLSAHLDTVHAPRENWEQEGWKHDPFAGEIDEEDGCLYGRGTVDMKNMAAMSISVLLFLKRHNIKLSRDLIFAAIADEERHNSYYGAKYLVENHPDLIEADIVMTELGAFSNHLHGKEFFPIQFAEKGACLVKITARGPGGHGSIYHKDNPVADISEVCITLNKQKLPHRLTEAAKHTIWGFSKLLPWHKGVVFRSIMSPKIEPWVMDYVLTEEQANIFGPMLHNTANTTIVEAGDQVNQIPSTASVTVDCRTLPGITVEQAIDDLKSVIGPEKFKSQDGHGAKLELEILAAKESFTQDPNEPVLAGILQTLGQVISKRSGGSPIAPYLLIGGTDQAQYIRHPTHKPICLGFSPVRVPDGMKLSKLFHGVNERIPVDGFKWGLGVLTESVLELCSASLTK